MDQQQPQQPQQETQPTQADSQVPTDHTNQDKHLWGYLVPCSTALRRYDFWKIKPAYHFGRHPAGNDITWPGGKISNRHCTITWNGAHGNDSIVVVEDKSSNGTFINGKLIGRGSSGVLRQGNEIAFGSTTPQVQDPRLDYRFIYRHLGHEVPDTGFFAAYDLMNELGKGSFATVMKALHRASGSTVAVKIINSRKVLRGNTSKESFLKREISILTQLKHPSIVECLDVVREEEGGGDFSIYLVMECVEGGDLLDRIIRSGGFTETFAVWISSQICRALCYIHSLNIVHRDLKPENILLTKGERPTVKIADFGLAKAFDNETVLRTMCGTPAYLAPEITCHDLRNGTQYNHLVDSWSAGVIVFSMLCNANPFPETDKDLVSTPAYMRSRKPEWTLLTGCNVSQHGISFIERLLALMPVERMDMRAALVHPWINGQTEEYERQHGPMQYLRGPPPVITEEAQEMTETFSQMDVANMTASMITSGMPGGYPREGNGLIRRAQVVTEEADSQRRPKSVASSAEGMDEDVAMDGITDGEARPSTGKRKSNAGSRSPPNLDESLEEDSDVDMVPQTKTPRLSGGRRGRGRAAATTPARRGRVNGQANGAEEQPVPRRVTRRTAKN